MGKSVFDEDERHHHIKLFYLISNNPISISYKFLVKEKINRIILILNSPLKLQTKRSRVLQNIKLMFFYVLKNWLSYTIKRV